MRPFSQFPYHKVEMSSDSDSEDCAGTTSRGPRRPDLQYLVTKGCLILCIIMLASVPGLVALTQFNSINTENKALPERIPIPIKHCGNTPDEARQLGCRFEIHNFAWVPPQCYDDTLSDDWDSHQTWVYSRAPNNSADTDEEFIAECRAGNVRSAWLPWWQHMAHCDIIMKKYMRSVMMFRPMDNWTSNWPHYEHCARMMARFDMDPLLYNSNIGLKFPTCDYSWLDNRPTTSWQKVRPAWHGGADYAHAPYCQHKNDKVMYDGIHKHD